MLALKRVYTPRGLGFEGIDTRSSETGSFCPSCRNRWFNCAQATRPDRRFALKMGRRLLIRVNIRGRDQDRTGQRLKKINPAGTPMKVAQYPAELPMHVNLRGRDQDRKGRRLQKISPAGTR
jgi:hypothetical protein